MTITAAAKAKYKMRDLILHGLYTGKTVKEVSKLDPWWLLREHENNKDFTLIEYAVTIVECEIAQQTN